MNKKVTRKIVALILSLAMCFSLNICAFANDTDTNVDPDIKNEAISGQNTAYIYGSGSFTVYCSGWSLLGKATISTINTASDNIITIDIKNPSGNSILSTPIMLTGVNINFEQNLFNISASFYTIEVLNSKVGSTVTVAFSDR